MNRLRTGTIALLTVLGAAPGVAATAAPPPLTCGDHVQGEVVLTQDLDCPDGVGLVLTGDTVLDLDGHRMTGPGAAAGAALKPADAANVDLVTVRDGTISGWEHGVAGWVYSRITAESVHFEDVGTALGWDTYSNQVVVDSSTFDRVRTGITNWDGAVTVTRSRFSDGGTALSVGTGIWGTLLVSDTVLERNTLAISCDEVHLTLTRLTFRDNGTGLEAYDGCGIDLADSTFARNDVGIVTVEGSPVFGTTGGTVVDSRFVDNGVAVELDTAPLLRGNRFTGNTTAIRSLADPTFPARLERNVLTRNGDAIYVTGAVEVLRNRVLDNSGYGIYAPLATDLGGNVAHRNGVEPQCTGVVCRRS